MTETAQAPLADIRVLELSHIVAGPSAGMMLADLGADVIRVERPDGGDPFRTSNPAMFAFFNRNKRGMAIDLKSDAGRDAFLSLVRDSDVVLDNFGYGVTDRLGLAYPTLRETNPGIIYLAIRGFLPGPYQERPLLDELAQTMGGLAYMTGPLGRPLRAGASVVDMGAAAYGVVGVLAALRQRDRTGQGQRITVGLFETVVFWNGQHMAEAAASGEPVLPFPERTQADRMGWGVYNLFETADGRQVFIGVTSDPQWHRFCRALGLADLLDDERLSSNMARAMARDWLIPRLRAEIRRLTAADLQDRLSHANVPFGAVNRPDELFADPHLNASGQLAPLPIPGDATAALPRLPFASDRYDRPVRRPAPGLGEHTREVLREAGFAEARIRELSAEGAVYLGEPLFRDG